MPAAKTTHEGNLLIHERSPYLLQHAHNPVHWRPWGPQALAEARKADKPIFLSVGYSTCHWCHVMERESFERKDIAAILNKYFIPIKVDREERPDVDEIYMTATQLMTGRGGWPNSVWLTPDGRPWYAGTYYPKPAFEELLGRLAEIWRTRRSDVEAQADEMSKAIRRSLAARTEPTALSHAPATAALEALRESFDKEHGGFGPAPKFPPHGALRLLAAEIRRTRSKAALGMLTRTLDAMAAGGMHDHLGGGFHRYSTDEKWLVPHFEKMLYDNAQLLRAYTDGFLLTDNRDYARVAEGIARWVASEMTDPSGGFYSALDADSEGEEGKFYLFACDEVIEALGPSEGKRFCRIYNVKKRGNWYDPVHRRHPSSNILHLAAPLAKIARDERTSEADLRAALIDARAKLLAVRDKRIRPHLDDKVLAGWNGLMIESLAYAGRHLGKPEYVAAAEQAAEFVLTQMRKDGRLQRSWRKGSAGVNGYLDDYAFLAEGLLELHAATRRKHWEDEAAALMEVLDAHFIDRSGGYYLTSDDHESLLARIKSPIDQAVPSGNAVAGGVLVRLERLKDARNVLASFAAMTPRAPRATSRMIVATSAYLNAGGQGAAPVKRASISAEGDRVSVECTAPADGIAPGAEAELTLRLTVDAGWHLAANAPGDVKSVLPTSVAMTDGPAALGKVAWPAGREVVLAEGDPAMAIYDGVTEVVLPVRIAADAPAGRTELELTATAQPCNDQSCLLPQKLKVRVPITVAPAKKQ